MKTKITMELVRECLEKAKEAGIADCWRWKDLNEMKTIEEVLAYPDLARAALRYAGDIIQGRWKIAEDIIAKDGVAAFWYAYFILRDPDPETWGKRYLKGEVK